MSKLNCGAFGFAPVVCEEPPGHEGDHVAFGQNAWPRVPRYTPIPFVEENGGRFVGRRTVACSFCGPDNMHACREPATWAAPDPRHGVLFLCDVHKASTEAAYNAGTVDR